MVPRFVGLTRDPQQEGYRQDEEQQKGIFSCNLSIQLEGGKNGFRIQKRRGRPNKGSPGFH